MLNNNNIERWHLRCTWMAQSIKRLAFDFSSGCDLRVLGWSQASGSPLSAECACPSPSAPPPTPSVSLFLSQINKYLKKKKRKITSLPETQSLKWRHWSKTILIRSYISNICYSNFKDDLILVIFYFSSYCKWTIILFQLTRFKFEMLK